MSYTGNTYQDPLVSRSERLSNRVRKVNAVTAAATLGKREYAIWLELLIITQIWQQRLAVKDCSLTTKAVCQNDKRCRSKTTFFS